MDVLVVSVREKDTRLAAMSVSGKKITIRKTLIARSILPALMKGAVDNAAAVISDAKEKMKCSYQKIHVLLPVRLIQAETWNIGAMPGDASPKKDTWLQEAERFVEKSFITEYPLVARLAMSKPFASGTFVSGLGIAASLRSTICAIAEKLKMTVCCIEPECFGIIRACGAKQLSVVEYGSDYVSVLIWHSDKGMITLSVPSPDPDSDACAADWKHSMSLVDYANAQYAPGESQAINVYFPGGAPPEEDGSRRRITPKALQIGDVKISGKGIDDVPAFLPLVASVVARSATTPNICGDFINLTFAKQTKKFEIKQFGGVLAKTACIASALFLIINLGMYGFFVLSKSDNITAALQKDFDAATAGLSSINRKMQTIAVAVKADQDVVKVADLLVSSRPNAVKISRYEVHETGNIEIEGFAPMPEVFNLYVDNLLQDKQVIRTAVLERMSASNSPTKDKNNTFMIRAAAQQ